MFEVNADQLKTCLIEDLKVGLTPMVASSPGMGKSDIIRSIAKEFNLKVIDFRVSQCEPVDMQGYPGVVDGRMTFHIPEYFPIEGDPIPYKLILDREVYKYKLHDRCLIAAAGNLTTDRAIVNTQSTATTSRLTHYRMQVDHKVWIGWANEHNIDHRIISLIKFKPEILHKFDPQTNELTFPCPRTWEFASKILVGKDNVDHVTKIRLAGTVGEGAAVELATYCDIYQSLPTIEEILKNPKTGWKVPKEPSERYAVTTMLAHNCTEQILEEILIAKGRLPKEFQPISLKDVYRRRPELRDHPLIKDWIAKNAANFFGN